jgi:hypothetical protein
MGTSLSFTERRIAGGATVSSGPVESMGASLARQYVTRRAVVAACLVVLATIALVLLLRPGQGVDARLRAIDVAYAIPEEDNAAKAYTEFAWGYAGPSLDVSLLPKRFWATILLHPWRSADYPQAAKWLEERRSAIDSLMDISRTPNCRFSVVEARREAERRSDAALLWSLMMLIAANNDLGDGRTEAGLEKLLRLLQTARHFRTQISPLDSYAGRTILRRSLDRLDRLVVMEDVPQEWLTRFEAILPPVDDGWSENDKQMEVVGWLCEQERERSVIERLTATLTRARESRGIEALNLWELSRCRASRILLALRRHKNQTGVWPATLAEIEGQIPPEALIDPLTKKPFIYRPTGDSLTLYHVGANGADDGGASDDYTIWPGRNR